MYEGRSIIVSAEPFSELLALSSHSGHAFASDTHVDLIVAGTGLDAGKRFSGT
jgi:hypothetical protein